MNSKHAAISLLLFCVMATPAVPKDEPIPAEGVVVAIERGKSDTRVVDQPEFVDLAEIFMVRVDHWSKPRNEKYIIVEYIHHSGLISYDQFDKTTWQFDVQRASPEETKDCLSWMAREPSSFVPTAFGANAKLPDPRTLPCFLMRKRPVPASPPGAVPR